MTSEELDRIEAFYGGRSVNDLQETYGLSLDELGRAVEAATVLAQRRQEEQEFAAARKVQVEEAERERREDERVRFKSDARGRFLQSNPLAEESDFERLFPRILDEYLLSQYREFEHSTRRESKGRF